MGLPVKKKRAKLRPLTEVMLVEDTNGDASDKPMSKLRQLFKKLRNVASSYCIGQQSMIDAALLAMLAQEHAIIVGPWGCNKTGTINTILHLAGAMEKDTFSITLDKFTTPEALLGMYSLSELKKDRYVRCMEGKMPEAKFAFVGEVFRSNGAVRASLHTILNERYVDNGGTHVQCPLMTAFLDSNSYPVREEDMPFYDRLLIRYDTGYLPATNASRDFTKMLGAATMDKKTQAPIMTMQHVHNATREVAHVAIPEGTLDLVATLRVELAADGIALSDRRWKKSLGVLRASAWLRGDDEVGLDDFDAFKHMLWNTPEQRVVLNKRLAAYSPSARGSQDEQTFAQAKKLFDEAQNSSTDSAEYSDAYSEINALLARVSTKEVRAKIEALISKMEDAIADSGLPDVV